MTRIALASLTQWITEAALAHGDELPAHLMTRLGINRRQAGDLLHQLVATQWLASDGAARTPSYSPGPLRQVVRRYAIASLQEDSPWRRDFAPAFELKPEVQRMAQHAYTELLNNAVDHSGGAAVTVSMRQTPLQVQLLVSDDGLGLFDRIARDFAIKDPAMAMMELSKGKLTSDPARSAHRHLGLRRHLARHFVHVARRAARPQRRRQRLPFRTHLGATEPDRHRRAR